MRQIEQWVCLPLMNKANYDDSLCIDLSLTWLFFVFAFWKEISDAFYIRIVSIYIMSVISYIVSYSVSLDQFLYKEASWS